MTLEEQDFVVVDDHDLADFNPAGILPQSSGDILRIQKWLQPTDYNAESSEYNKHLTSYVPGTGQWIQTNEQYQQWLQSPEHGTLWLKGIAGSGKSVIAAHIAATLSDEKVPVLKFFFRQIIATNKTPQSLLRDWLSQLLEFSPLLQLKLVGLLENRRTLDSMAFDELWDLLVLALSGLALSGRQRVYCIADALDEMDLGNETFIRKIIELGKTKASVIKVFATSRPLPYLEKALSHNTVVQISLQSRVVDPDISTYIRARLGQTMLPLDLQSNIEKVLGKKCQGLFLYARLMLDELLELSDSPSVVDDALQKLPLGLSEMYTRMLYDHSTRSGTPQNLQLLILQSVTHASRPLRLLELAAITDFVHQQSGSTILSGKVLSQDTKAIIRNGCGPLLEILEDETVSIIHHSLTEFLVGTERSKTAPSDLQFPCINSPDTHLAMAKLCLQYILASLSSLGLNSGDIENKSQTKSTPENARMSFPFLGYAAKNFDYHMLRTDTTSDGIFLLLDRLFCADSEILYFYFTLLSPELEQNKTLPLHFVASKGLAAYAKHLTELGHDPNCLELASRTPLHYAAAHGHANVVEVLLECGASNNPDDRCGLTPLHLSASANHSRVVEKLLVSGVDPLTPKTKEDPGNWCGNASRTVGDTALEYAASYGHTEAAIEFLPFLDIDGLSKALHWAAAFGKTETVLAILEDPRVDVNKVINSKTAIHLSSHSHDLSSMKKLLQLGADATIKCDSIFHKTGIRAMGPEDLLKFSSLHAYAQGFNKQNEPLERTLGGLQMLLDAGCDINEYDGYGQTILHTILQTTTGPVSFEIIQYLLNHGANPSFSSKNGSTPLHFGAEKSEQVVKLLISHGADMNARDRDGRTPLCGAANPAVLINLGADCNVQDNEGNTPLHLAMENWSLSIPKVKGLLDGGTDPNAKNKKGDTLLHTIRSWFNQGELIQIMVAAGANLEAKNAHGLTVLLRAIENRASRLEVEPIVDAGADISARDPLGQTILHYCSLNDRSADTIQWLVKRGADAFCKDYAGNTLFHQVAKQSSSTYGENQLALLETILELGLSPSAQNNEGQTPFHIAASMHRTDTRDTRWVTRTSTSDPYKFLLGPKCKLDVNTADHNGICPIHLAASLTDYQVIELLDLGADPTVVTLEGITPLHVACRSRQSNIVGLLVDEYLKRGLSHMIDYQDIEGRSALHHAARSGRSESVAILLRLGGAQVDLKDRKALTPLDVCTEIADEEVLWKTRRRSSGIGSIRAAAVKLSDLNRPWGGENENGNCGKAQIKSEADKSCLREIVRLLVAHGANISFLVNRDFRQPRSYTLYNSFTRALDAGCETMADELLALSEGLESGDIPDEKEQGEEDPNLYEFYEPWDHFVEKTVLLRSRSSLDLLQELVKPGDSNLSIFHNLLHAEDERGVAEFKRLRADLLKPDRSGESCVTLLVKWGYATLLKNYGQGAALMTEEWIKETEKTEINLPGRLKQPLLIACARKVPNLDVIKVLVEDFQVDVNAKYKDETAVHILSACRHWWHLGALEYLLQHGVDSKTKNEALHIAIPCGRGEAAVKILLQHGADPNCMDSEGTTCLNNASKYPVIVQALIKHGADVSAGNRPFVFDAIRALDLKTIDLLVEMGADLNIRPKPDEEPVFGENELENKFILQRMIFNTKTLAETSYPIHFAASSKFNSAEARPKILPIIEALLRGGADPFRAYDEKGNSILHELCLTNGIISPFLSLPNTNLEARDSEGRTLLLAAASTAADYWDGHNIDESPSDAPSTVRMLIAKWADITAVDNEGRNVLHHLLTCSDKYNLYAHPASDIHDFNYVLSFDLGHQLAIQKDKSGASPLHHALKKAQLWAVEPLLAKGANPLEPDPEGDTALHYLVGMLSDKKADPKLAITLFERFLELGVDINAVNNLGETPIFSLVSGTGYSVDDIQKLEQKGADLKMLNNKRQNLLHMIALQKAIRGKTQQGDESTEICVFRYLMGKKLDSMAEDNESRTPLDIAVANGNVGVLEMFKRDV
jgi:ankyrin repeat protein